MKKIVVVVGLTSSGKSGLGIDLARKFNGEIVSADSRQVYRGLDWCSGKVTDAELAMARHHLIDVANLGEQFTLFDFQKKAYDAIEDILSRGKLPILVGGTGLYSRSIVEGFELSEGKADLKLRESLEKLPREQLLEKCKELKVFVPSEVTDRRLVRLIEKASQPQKENKARYEVLQIGIDWEREQIHSRIRQRLEFRMPNMIKEIENLLSCGVSKDFLMSLGLEAKFIIRFLDGEFSSYEEFFELLFTEERHFAKRQKTWYKKEKNIVWIDGAKDPAKNASRLVEEFLNSK